mmetsp:Transcript_39930/g.73698  ORF Transcript_39930/g.73698 Transcript_39930/m.73698 type:complete len:208 (-) Transcript_39930:1523-2146(-)
MRHIRDLPLSTALRRLHVFQRLAVIHETVVVFAVKTMTAALEQEDISAFGRLCRRRGGNRPRSLHEPNGLVEVTLRLLQVAALHTDVAQEGVLATQGFVAGPELGPLPPQRFLPALLRLLELSPLQLDPSLAHEDVAHHLPFHGGIEPHGQYGLVVALQGRLELPALGQGVAHPMKRPEERRVVLAEGLLSYLDAVAVCLEGAFVLV